jgi:hypothetical protein
MMTSCSSCGAARPEAAVRFCLTCGQQFTDESDAPPAAEAYGTPSGHRPTTGYEEPAASPSLLSPGPPTIGHGRRGLLIGLVALVVVAGGGTAAYALMGHSRSHTDGPPAGNQGQTAASGLVGSSSAAAASASEQDQLSQLLAVIRQSVTARSLVTTAVAQVGTCSMAPDDGVTQLQQAITDRQNAMASMNTLPISAIPNGQSMVSSLGSVLQFSIDADNDFIGWMQDPTSTQNCPTSPASDSDADYSAGLNASAQAVQAKNQFLGIWNPLAAQFQLPSYTQQDL